LLDKDELDMRRSRNYTVDIHLHYLDVLQKFRTRACIGNPVIYNRISSWFMGEIFVCASVASPYLFRVHTIKAHARLTNVLKSLP